MSRTKALSANLALVAGLATMLATSPPQFSTSAEASLVVEDASTPLRVSVRVELPEAIRKQMNVFEVSLRAKPDRHLRNATLRWEESAMAYFRLPLLPPEEIAKEASRLRASAVASFSPRDWEANLLLEPSTNGCPDGSACEFTFDAALDGVPPGSFGVTFSARVDIRGDEPEPQEQPTISLEVTHADGR